MFEFEELETVDPSPVEVHFLVAGELLAMRLPRSGMTPREIVSVWEGEWGVRYAARLRFASAPDTATKWLNQDSDEVPPSPAVVKLDGMGSILQGVASALRRRGGSLTLPEEEEAESLPEAVAAPAKVGLGPLQRGEFKQYMQLVHKKPAKFGQGRGEGIRWQKGELSKEDELRRESGRSS